MIAILTYHSQVLSDNVYGCNDHVSLARDLRLIDSLGKKIIPLSWAVEWARGERELNAHHSVCITFDDGATLDWRDEDYPGLGQQRGFAGILRDFISECGQQRQPHLEATSFVIACPEARRAMDAKSLFGRDWMGESWWPDAEASGLIRIENHSWDHFHPDASADNTGNFTDIADAASCRRQLVAASHYIAERSGRRPRFFAYPCGQRSAYLRDTFLPECRSEHGLEAAFTIDAGYLTRSTNLWDVPRFVSMQHWRQPGELEAILCQTDAEQAGERLAAT